jgi:hypothetical protein
MQEEARRMSRATHQPEPTALAQDAPAAPQN